MQYSPPGGIALGGRSSRSGGVCPATPGGRVPTRERERPRGSVNISGGRGGSFRTMDGAELVRRLKSLKSLKNCEIYLHSTDDTWCAPTNLPALYVLNTARSRGVGEHYVAFFVHPDRSVSYFDSYGIPPFSCLKKFWKRHDMSPVISQKRLLQSPLSFVCGHYVIAFAAFVSSGVTLKGFVSGFTGDHDLNDRHVSNFVRKELDFTP